MTRASDLGRRNIPPCRRVIFERLKAAVVGGAELIHRDVLATLPMTGIGKLKFISECLKGVGWRL